MYIDKCAYTAVEAMARMALHDVNAPLTSMEIAAWLDESSNQIEPIMACLDAAGLATHSTGPTAGYCLALPAGEISVANIVEALEDLDDGGSHDSLTNEEYLRATGADALSQVVRGWMMLFLRDISLADILPNSGGDALIEPKRSAPVAWRSRVLH